LENSGGFDGFGAKALANDSDDEDGYSTVILESMTLEDKAATWQAMLEEDNKKIASK
jgi:hypothetical protein